MLGDFAPSPKSGGKVTLVRFGPNSLAAKTHGIQRSLPWGRDEPSLKAHTPLQKYQGQEDTVGKEACAGVQEERKPLRVGRDMSKGSKPRVSQEAIVEEMGQRVGRL